MRTLWMILTSALLCCGCASYEYQVVAPPSLVGHIGPSIRVMPLDPLVYRAQSFENRLVLQIGNPTNDSITLLGQQSFIIDPLGESRPLHTQTIGPGSFIKLILPPMSPQLEPRGPMIGVNLGYQSSRTTSAQPPIELTPESTGEPRYFSTSGSSSDLWHWEGQTLVRMTLVFERRGKVFQQSFEFRRVKM